MVTKTKIIAVAAVLAAGAATAAASTQTRYSQHAPFTGLDELPHVMTSNDEYTIWVHWEADAFEVQYPDGRPAFDRAGLDPDELGPLLTFSCRADGRAENLIGPESLRAVAELPMHPEAPDVPGPLSIRFYLLAFYGEWEEWPARVQLDGVDEQDGMVRRQRIHYAFARPELQVVGVSGSAREGLARIAAGNAWHLQIEGEGMRVDATFAALPAATSAAAREMQRHCSGERHTATR